MSVKTEKLDPDAKITDLTLNKVYLGKVLRNGLILLNKNIKGRLTETNTYSENDSVAVSVVKINYPDGLILKSLGTDIEIQETKKDISMLSITDVGKYYSFYVKIEEINQTSGPTLFVLNDGSGAIVAKAFVKPGLRAFPELNKEHIVKVKLLIKEYQGNIEAELLSSEKLDEKESDRIMKKLESELDKKSLPAQMNYLVKSQVLLDLTDNIINVAKEIKKAILESRPIIVRHHADCDGYCGGVAIERAILPLIITHHRDENAQWHYYKRCPSKTPFYDYIDATKDLVSTLKDMARFGMKEPLIILIDNGSCSEDIMAIRKVKIYNAKCVVIDHHNPGIILNKKAEVDKYIDAHVNPYLVGGNKNLSAGMLATEVARFINKDVLNIEFLPALAGIGDRCDGEEFNSYLEIAGSMGYDRGYLKEISECIDFEAHYLKFLDSRGLVDDLLGENKEIQKKLVNLLYQDVLKRKDEQFNAIKHYLEVVETDKLVIGKLNVADVTFKGDYPPPGKVTGLTQDYLRIKYPEKKVITVGFGSDFITIRTQKEFTGFNINLMIKEIETKKPYTLCDGGGHENAGTLKFIEAARNEVLEFVLSYIKRVANN